MACWEFGLESESESESSGGWEAMTGVGEEGLFHDLGSGDSRLFIYVLYMIILTMAFPLR